MQTEILNVSGMTSEGCADAVSRALKSVAGVNDVSVSLLHSQATVEFDETLVAKRQLKGALANAGYANAKSDESECGGCCGSCGGN